MTKTEFGIVGVGNALVDILAQTDEAFITAQHKEHGMEKGAMTLINESRALALYDQMPAGIESSGGSAGNTLAGFASFGGIGAFIGKVADDQLGRVFRHDLQAMGVHYKTPSLIFGAPTGRCMILVTPDAERTMNTFLGASVELKPDDIDEELIAQAKVTYLEGYLFDKDQAKAAFHLAAEFAHKAKRRVALTLSDPFCVARHRKDFLKLVTEKVDILFANEHELKSLYQTESFEEALLQVTGHCEIAVVTCGKKGAIIISDGERIQVDATKVDDVLDTTGAGDQFAAGFLYGFTQGYPLEVCGRLGCLAAGEVITHMGPRPQTKYATLIPKVAA